MGKDAHQVVHIIEQRIRSLESITCGSLWHIALDKTNQLVLDLEQVKKVL